MGIIGRSARRIGYLFNRHKLEVESDREMAAHRAMLGNALRFGNTLRLREQSSDVWGWGWIDEFHQDFRYALRLVYRAPGFAVPAIATLTLGLGASIVTFSIAYGISLRPLPYPEPERLMRIYESHSLSGRLKSQVSIGAFEEWRRSAKGIESAALIEQVRLAHLADGAEEPVTWLRVSPAFFRTLGAAPLFGPGFKPEDEYTPRTANEVVLSYGAWQRLYGGRPNVIGTRLHFWRDNEGSVIVGVMPAAFAYGPAVDVWRPVLVEPPIRPAMRNLRQTDVIARLKTGVTIEQAQAELDGIAARLGREFRATNEGWGVTVEPLQAALIGDFGRSTWMLFAAVVVVLLVACVNVASLLLARALARERETAVREVLGATKFRLFRLWLTEAVLLNALGGSLGLALAWYGVITFRAMAPPQIPRLDAIRFDLPVLIVGMLFVLLSTAIITLALQSRSVIKRSSFSHGSHASLPSRTQMGHHHVGAGNSAYTDSRHAMRRGLLLFQCAGAVALLALAVMFTRSFINLTSFDLGWNPTRILSMNVSPGVIGGVRSRAGLVNWSDRVISRLESEPAIEQAAVTTQVPLSSLSYTDIFAEGRRDSRPEGRRWTGVRHTVTDGYFTLMDIDLLAGRVFKDSDRFTPAQIDGGARESGGVVVISETVGRTLWPGQSPIGQTLHIPNAVDSVAWREVIGVVEDIRFYNVAEDPGLHIFVPWTQAPLGALRLLVKATHKTGQAALPSLVRSVLMETDPGGRVDRMASLDSLVVGATAQSRFTARAVTSFGILALALAALGIYGTLSYVIATRAREIAIRLSVGASHRIVITDALRYGLTPVAGGAIAGVLLSALFAHVFERLLVAVNPLDATSFACAVGLLCVGALAAALRPTLRLLRIDPAVALHAE